MKKIAAFFMFLGMAPENQDRAAEIRRFVDRHWTKGSGK
jgi:hypothetical protein